MVRDAATTTARLTHYRQAVSMTTTYRLFAMRDKAEIIVLNDQGGSVMDVSDKAATLRAQEHGHQSIVCFENDHTQVEAMSHDIFHTKFCKDGKVDPLANSDYKEPPIVAYRNSNG